MSDPAIYQQYLESLKGIVEGLLVTQVANVWSIYGGLNRLYLCLEKIFRHGCKSTSQEGYFYNFIQGLEWLQPAPLKSYFSLDCEYRPYVPLVLKDDKSFIWLFRVLESHSLCVKLSWLLSDEAHLNSCYEPWAFLCQKDYTDATLICLRAVEKNQATYLSEIDPRLFVRHAATSQFSRSHRRCSSFPIKYSIKSKSGAFCDVVDSPVEKRLILGKLKPWSSLPALQIDSSIKCSKKVHFTNKTTPNTPLHNKKISPNMLKVDYSKYKDPTKNSSKKVKPKAVLINNSDIIEYAPALSSSHSSGAAPEDLSNSCASCSVQREKKKGFFLQSPLSIVEYSFLPRQGEKDYSRRQPKSFIEDGGMSILPMSTGQGYLPKPIKGQTLTSYLTTSKMAHSNAELDRENAHFSVSEAIISAMEKLKCQYREHVTYFDSKMHSDSDENETKLLNDLKQRIRLRRRRRFTNNTKYHNREGILSDGKTDTTTTASPTSSPSDSFTDWSSSDEDVQDVEIEEANTLREKLGLSMSMASLYSEADIFKSPRGAPDGASEITVAASPGDILSPEGVALSLISKFNEKHLPKASDLEWLVSEKDAPQALLPLPQSWPVNPDDFESNSTQLLRGTRNWAPPRPQIVLSLLPAPVRKGQMEKQNYKCAGCGMRVATQYASKFRYCHYLGKYFCTGCHKNQVSLIPARILHKWDFNRYPVSTFSFKLLEQMYSDPLFRIFEINKYIGKFSKNLEFIRKYRQGLSYLKEYIFNCRFAETAQERLEQDLPGYFLSKPDEYSIDDLVNIKNGDLKTKLKFLVDICLRHTSKCTLCLARGYICELCQANEVIFPWQMRLVIRCLKCGTCYHTNCWNQSKEANKCPKCSRKLQRSKNVACVVITNASK